MKRTYPRQAAFLLLVMVATLVLPFAVLAMGKDPEDTRKEKIEKTQSADLHGQQRDSGNLFDAYGAWKERRKELEEEKEGERLLPTEESLNA